MQLFAVCVVLCGESLKKPRTLESFAPLASEGFLTLEVNFTLHFLTTKTKLLNSHISPHRNTVHAEKLFNNPIITKLRNKPVHPTFLTRKVGPAA